MGEPDQAEAIFLEIALSVDLMPVSRTRLLGRARASAADLPELTTAAALARNGDETQLTALLDPVPKSNLFLN